MVQNQKRIMFDFAFMAVKKLRKCPGFVSYSYFLKRQCINLQSCKLHGGTCMWKRQKECKRGTWSFSVKNGIHCTNGEGSEYLRAWPPHIKLCLVNPSPRDVSEMKLHAHEKYRILRLMHEFEKPRKGKI